MKLNKTIKDNFYEHNQEITDFADRATSLGMTYGQLQTKETAKILHTIITEEHETFKENMK